jgi:hypothetical protein
LAINREGVAVQWYSRPSDTRRNEIPKNQGKPQVFYIRKIAKGQLTIKIKVFGEKTRERFDLSKNVSFRFSLQNFRPRSKRESSFEGKSRMSKPSAYNGTPVRDRCEKTK